jgi:hypothetical protein
MDSLTQLLNEFAQTACHDLPPVAVTGARA